jgi:hypothetical protein
MFCNIGPCCSYRREAYGNRDCKLIIIYFVNDYPDIGGLIQFKGTTLTTKVTAPKPFFLCSMLRFIYTSDLAVRL